MAAARRTEWFDLILSPAERAGLRYLADAEGVAEDDVIRRLLQATIDGVPAEVKQAIGWSTPSDRTPG